MQVAGYAAGELDRRQRLDSFEFHVYLRCRAFPGNSLARSGSRSEPAPRSRYVFVLTRELSGLRRDRDVGGDETQESNRCVSQQGAVKRRTRARTGYAAWASSRRPQHLPGRGLARQCNVADRPWHAFGLVPGNMKSDASPASGVRRQLSPQQRAVEQLRALVKPYRFRVQVDAEGLPLIPGRYGRIEWHCDGVNCWSCALPGQVALAVYSDCPRLFEKLWAIPGMRRHQIGDTEMRAVFPPEALEQVAQVIKARRRRTLAPEEARRRGFKPTHRATSKR